MFRIQIVMYAAVYVVTFGAAGPFVGWKLAAILTAASVACAGFFFVPLMGLPGMVSLMLSYPWFRLIGHDVNTVLAGDKMWPSAIMTSFLLPLMFTPAYVVAFYSVESWSMGMRWLVFGGIVALWASFCPLILFWNS